MPRRKPLGKVALPSSRRPTCCLEMDRIKKMGFKVFAFKQRFCTAHTNVRRRYIYASNEETVTCRRTLMQRKHDDSSFDNDDVNAFFSDDVATSFEEWFNCADDMLQDDTPENDIDSFCATIGSLIDDASSLEPSLVECVATPFIESSLVDATPLRDAGAVAVAKILADALVPTR